MAALTALQRTNIRIAYSQLVSSRRDGLALSRVDLDAAITAIDLWIDANAGSYNNALPAAAKANLTAAQKAELLAAVAQVRFGG